MERDLFFDLKSKNKLESLIVGVDLGQTHDYTAISTLEKYQVYSAWNNEKVGQPFYHIRFLERVALGTPYPEVVRITETVYKNLQEQLGERPVLVIDSSGVGRPVFDAFKEIDLNPVGIVIHGGSAVSRLDGRKWSVPKRDIIGYLQILNQSNRLIISPKLELRETFIHELLNIRVKININTGHDSYEAWREGDHDDIVLAVGCGAWWGKYLDRQFTVGVRLPGV